MQVALDAARDATKNSQDHDESNTELDITSPIKMTNDASHRTRPTARRVRQAPYLARHQGALRGRCIGLLGPNGAGKTTLIHTLLGFHSAVRRAPRASSVATFAPRLKQIRTVDRLYARARLVHRQHDLRPFRAPDGRALRAARRRPRSNARTRRSFTSAWAKRVIASSARIRSA